MSNGLMLLIAGLLVFLNGFFVAAEYALVKVRSTRIEELVRGGSAAARLVREELRHLDRFIGTTQFGITICSLGLGWAGERAVEHLVAPILPRLGLNISPRVVGIIAAAAAFAVITGFHIVVGEQVPKIMAIQRAERVALFCSYPLQLFYRLFRAPVAVLNAATRSLTRAIGLGDSGHHELAHSEEELRMILTASLEGGVIRESEHNLIDHVFVFADKRAREVMVPRVDITYLDTEWSFERNHEVATSHTYTRFPLCQGDPDHVIGLIHIRDLLNLANQPNPDLLSIRREIVVVPETKPIDQLLREFQVRKIHMARVLDEYGGTAGIVTLEDVLEQLVGEIHDEFEEPSPEVHDLGDGKYLVDGKASLIDLRNDHEIDIPQNGSDTLGGWILDQSGSIPENGTVVAAGPYSLEVTEIDGQRIRKVLITRTQPEVGEEAEEE